jgi:hypothetical protein
VGASGPSGRGFKVVGKEKKVGSGRSKIKICFWTVAIEVYLLSEHAVFELNVLFPFLLVTAT